MVDTLEIINQIRKFKLALPNIAFAYNSPIKLYKIPGFEDSSIMAAIEKLEEYIRKSKDNQITFTDYNELQDFMRVNSIVETGCNFPTVEDIQKENEKAFRSLGFNMYGFYPHFKSIYDTWVSKQRYLPNEVLTDEFKSIVKKYNSLYATMLEKWREVNRDKAEYLNNTYIAFKDIEDIFSLDTWSAYTSLSSWVHIGLDPKYIINLQYLDQDLLRLVDTQLKQAKYNKALEKRKEEAEQKKKEEAIKANPEAVERRNNAINEFENAYSKNSDFLIDMESKARAYNGIAEQVSTLPVEASEGQLDNLQQQLETLKKQGEDALAQLNNISKDIDNG